MNHTLLIAGAILLCIAALVAALIIVTKNQRRKRKEQLRLDFNLLLGRHDLQATQQQEFEHRIIALDPARNAVAYIQDDITKPSIVVELQDVSDIRLWKEGQRSGVTETATGLRPDEHIAAIGLAFSMRNGESHFMPFYSEILDGIGARADLAKEAEEWLRRLQAAGNSRSRQGATAMAR